MSVAALDETRVKQCVVRLSREDITDLELDAFVYYAQEDLSLGSGFGGAIGVRGGPTVQKELDDLGPLATGEAIITTAGNLKAKYIVHAVGPRFQEQDIESKLRTTMENTLTRAEEAGIQRLAFPLMGAGFYGIPNDLSARVMVEVLAAHLAGEANLQEVVICALDTPQYNSLQAALAALE